MSLRDAGRAHDFRQAILRYFNVAGVTQAAVAGNRAKTLRFDRGCGRERA
jgi:UDP-glucose 4-epimerase